MELTDIHFILTYKCNKECEHCCTFSSPTAQGTFTSEQLSQVFNELAELKTIRSILFEGGEPFLFTSLLLEGIKAAKVMNLEAAVVTNVFWAKSEKAAEIRLALLAESGAIKLIISDDLFHYKDRIHANNAFVAADKIGIPTSYLSVKKPEVQAGKLEAGGVRFLGRAVEKLAEGLPGKPSNQYSECPYEDFRNPQTIHLDPFGNVFICHGLSIGNMWQISLTELLRNYEYDKHPICRLLAIGGPTLLAQTYGLDSGEYLDACHLCFLTRKTLMNKYPYYLAPKQLYGVEEA